MIDIKLLSNKRSRQSMDGLDVIVAAQPGGYSVIAGENNATTFTVNYPTEFLTGHTGYVYMKNAIGEYAVQQFGPLRPNIQFTLPASMTFRGNTHLVFYAITGTGENLIKVIWSPVIIPITETGVDYERVALASPDTLAEAIAASNAANIKSNEALSTANIANTKSDNAVLTADAANIKADEAISNSSDAVSTANTANTKSDDTAQLVASALLSGGIVPLYYEDEGKYYFYELRIRNGHPVVVFTEITT